MPPPPRPCADPQPPTANPLLGPSLEPLRAREPVLHPRDLAVLDLVHAHLAGTLVVPLAHSQGRRHAIDVAVLDRLERLLEAGAVQLGVAGRADRLGDER